MAGTPNDRLDSWKEIAEYLRRDITTALRWAKARGLPVHRVPGGKRHAVFAYRAEIDAWLGNGARSEALAGPRQESAPINRGATVVRTPRTALPYAIGALGLACIVAATYYLARPLPAPRVLGYRKLTNDGFMKPGGIVTDGPRVYFTEARPTGNAIVQVSTSGGEAVPLSTFLKNPAIQDLDRRHSEILVLDSDSPGKLAPLWAVPLSGGLPRRVGDVLAGAAAWSPDGNAIAFSADRDLYISRPDGSESRKIASLPGRMHFIRWSPDGRRLRASVFRSETEASEIWESQADGSYPHRVITGWPALNNLGGGQWLPDGKYFIAQRADVPELWALREERGILRLGKPRPVQLTAGPLDICAWALSADGRGAFALARGGAPRLGTLRCGSKTIRAVSPRHFCRRSGLLARWPMDRVRQRP